jgi:hypothetical protein
VIVRRGVPRAGRRRNRIDSFVMNIHESFPEEEVRSDMFLDYKVKLT